VVCRSKHVEPLKTLE